MNEPTLGDFLKSINETKENILRGESAAQKAYPSFVVAKSLSYHIDCILFVNELNKLGYIDNLQHYEFLLHSIRRGHRFSRWTKVEKTSDVAEALMKLYGYSREKAREVEKVLTETQAKAILDRLALGGIQK